MGLVYNFINKQLLIMTIVKNHTLKRRLQTKDLKRRETREVSVGTALRRLRAAGGTVLQECWTKQMQEL